MDQLFSQMSRKITIFFFIDRFFHAELQSFITSLTRGNFYREMSDMGARLPRRLVNANTSPKQPFETIACNQQKARENGARKF